MQEVLDVFDRQGLIGIWTAHQESEIVGDPNCSRAGHGNEFSWRLSIPTVKAAFMDSQERISLYLPISHYISLYLTISPYISLYLPTSPAFMDSQSGEQLGAAQASATDEMALLSFPEFQELVARVGLDKYRPIKAMTPAAAVRAMHQNILGEKNEEQAVVDATRITATGYDAANLAVARPLLTLTLTLTLNPHPHPQHSPSTPTLTLTLASTLTLPLPRPRCRARARRTSPSGSTAGGAWPSWTCTCTRCGRRRCTTSCSLCTRSSPASSLRTRAPSPRTPPRTRSRCRWRSSTTSWSTWASRRPSTSST